MYKHHSQVSASDVAKIANDLRQDEQKLTQVMNEIVQLRSAVNNDIPSQINRFKGEMKISKDNRNTIQSELKTHETDLRKAEGDYREAENKLKRLEEDIRRLPHDEEEKVEPERRRLGKEVEEAKKESDKAKDKISELEPKIKFAKEEIIRESELFKEAETNRGELEKDLQKLRRKLADLEMTMSALGPLIRGLDTKTKATGNY